MKKIRRGNDFVFAWEIERNGLPENLSSVLEKHLYLSVLGKRVELLEGVDYDITGNVVRIEVTPTIANILGTYKAEFHYILPDNGLIDEDRKCAVDVDAFVIVNSTAQADEPSEFTVTSDMAIAFKGDKGDPLTYDDLTPEQKAELQQPATDAIASIQEVELAVETAEALRVQAELNRQTNTSTAILNAEQATDDANDAAILANEKAGLAATATTEANTARDEANLAATAANTAAGDANDAAEAANTAAGLADTARLAIQSDLALKADEADLVQLAGDVSLLDAVQGAKIKDIENALSTANLGQSTQVSVSGVSPLPLPKNAANGGMSVKMEGLTEDVGGVITHFVPTGRVRSVGKNMFNFDYWKEISKYPTPAGGGYYSGSLRLRPNTTYTFSVTLKGSEKPSGYIRVSGGDGALFTISSPVTTYPLIRSLTTGSDGIITLYVAGGQSGLTSQFERTNFMLVEGSIPSLYEPYRETSLYLTAPELRSNGTVKDEIRKGANGYELVKRISEVDGTVLATPVITPVSYGGILNSAENGTVYHEPVIADAGVYGTDIPIFNTDYPIASIEEIIKHEGGVDTYLNASTAVIAPDGLSFTHPDLESGDLVLFTYSFAKESTNGNITATFYDSNVVKIDTVTGKAYKINEVVTNGVLTRTLTEV